MAQAATNPKIEELRFRLKSDAKSRLFYPLAEELRKISQYDEAESVLRAGLAVHPTYLSAWVSLGRVLREQKKNNEAVEALNKALQLDPGNVVAARILADAYLALGEKVEAIKKYKLVYALLPSDQTLEATIERLEAEINAPAVIPEPEPEPGGAEAVPSPVAGVEIVAEAGEAQVLHEPESPFVEPPRFDEPPPVDPRVFDDTASALLQLQRSEIETGDVEPMRAAHTESPFEEPAGYGEDAFAIEHPSGMHVTSAPLTAEMPVPPRYEPSEIEPPPPAPEQAVSADEADVFEPAAGGIAPGFVTADYAVISSMPPIDEADFARTIRMADLYAMEGSIDEARSIYEDLLARDPTNATIRAKLDALDVLAPPAALPVEQAFAGEATVEDFAASSPAAIAAAEPATKPEPEAPSRVSNPKVEKLESWLARVKRGEVGRV